MPGISPPAAQSLRASAWFMLAMLTAVNAVNWADRQVVSVLAPGMREELALTDTQLGIIGGLAFALIYAGSSFVFGFAADRRIRRNIIAVGLVTWSLATVASGLARGFGTLFLARFFTGVGEASLYPAAMSLIGERFPVATRGRAMGIFGAAAAVGGGLGIGVGGLLSETIGWRAVFVLYGSVGLLLLPMVLGVPEERRPQPTGADAKLRGVLLALIRDPRLVLLWTSGMVMIGSGMGYAFFAPTYFHRFRDFDMTQAGILFGLAMLVGGFGGSLLGGAMADRRHRRRYGGELEVSIVAALVAAPLAALTLVSEWMPLVVVSGVLAPMAIFAYFPPIQAVIVEIVPARQHGIAYAVNIFFLAGIGQSLGPGLIGYVSDHADNLATGMVVPISGMVLASLLMVAARALLVARQAREEASQDERAD